jgi:hypothetical protein
MGETPYRMSALRKAKNARNEEASTSKEGRIRVPIDGILSSRDDWSTDISLVDLRCYFTIHDGTLTLDYKAHLVFELRMLSSSTRS